MLKYFSVISLVVFGFLLWRADFVFFTEKQRKICTLQVNNVIPTGTFGSLAGLDFELQRFLTSPSYRKCLFDEDVQLKYDLKILDTRKRIDAELVENALKHLPTINARLMVAVENTGSDKFSDLKEIRQAHLLDSMSWVDSNQDAISFISKNPTVKFTFPRCHYFSNEFSCDLDKGGFAFIKGDRFNDATTDYFLTKTLLEGEEEITLFMEPRVEEIGAISHLVFHVIGLEISAETVKRNWPRKKDSAEIYLRHITVPMFKFNEAWQFSLW